MIVGTVIARRAYIPLLVRGLAGQEGEVEFVLDTGFTGVTTLPPAACTALGLSLERLQPAHLADVHLQVADGGLVTIEPL